MKLNARFALLLGLLLAALVSSVVVLTDAHHEQTKRSVALLQREQALQLDNLLTLTSYPLQQYTRDYSLWDEILEFVSTKDPEWAKINLDASLDTFRLAATWVLDVQGNEVYSSFRPPLSGDQRVFDASQLVLRLRQSPFLHFYAKLGDRLLEFQTAPIQPSSDTTRTSPAAGWLVAARYWDENALQSLAEITRAQVSIEPADYSTRATRETSGSIEIVRELPSLQGGTMARLRLSYEPEQLKHLERYGKQVVTVLVVQGVAAILVLVIGLRLWVVNPFRRISDALALHDDRPVQDLTRSPSELGHIARLVKEYFAAESALKRSEHALSRALEERVRLGRELHDGVIQSIYAAGMGLAATRDSIKSEPEAAARKIDEIRCTLNETIREVRSYIMRLELGDLQPKSFRECVDDVIQSFDTEHLGKLDVEIDEAAAERLPVNLRTDALSRIRDWLYKSFRDGACTRLTLKIQEEAGKTVVSMRDDNRDRSESSPDPDEPATVDSSQRIQREVLPDGTRRTTISYSRN